MLTEDNNTLTSQLHYDPTKYSIPITNTTAMSGTTPSFPLGKLDRRWETTSAYEFSQSGFHPSSSMMSGNSLTLKRQARQQEDNDEDYDVWKTETALKYSSNIKATNEVPIEVIENAEPEIITTEPEPVPAPVIIEENTIGYRLKQGASSKRTDSHCLKEALIWDESIEPKAMTLKDKDTYRPPYALEDDKDIIDDLKKSRGNVKRFQEKESHTCPFYRPLIDKYEVETKLQKAMDSQHNEEIDNKDIPVVTVNEEKNITIQSPTAQTSPSKKSVSSVKTRKKKTVTSPVKPSQAKTLKKKRKIIPSKKKKNLPALLQEARERLRKQAAQSSRFLADGGFHEMFDKPTWHDYGGGNIHPSTGGIIYGDYMKTHNVASCIPPYYPPDEYGSKHVFEGALFHAEINRKSKSAANSPTRKVKKAWEIDEKDMEKLVDSKEEVSDVKKKIIKEKKKRVEKPKAEVQEGNIDVAYPQKKEAEEEKEEEPIQEKIDLNVHYEPEPIQVNPKDYKYLPPSYTKMIPAAGILTNKSESVSSLLQMFA